MKQLWNIMIAAVLLTAISGCGGPELEKLTVQYDSASVIVDVLFSETVPYTVSREPGGQALILAIPGAAVAKNISRERLIEGSDLISGWFAAETGSDIRLKIYLTGEYPFDHTAFAYSDKGRDGYLVRMKIAPGGVSLSSEGADSAPENSPTEDQLARGIRFYSEGRFDAALDQFRRALDTRGRLPLAYYYAARIRFDRGQRERAEENLKEALADSAAFIDAAGLLAHVQSLRGNGSEAAVNWKRFTSSFALQDDGERRLAGEITHPDSFKAILMAFRQERQDRELQNRQAEQARQDSLKRAEAVRDSLRIAAAAAKPDSGATAAASNADTSRALGPTVIEEGGGTEDFDIERFTRDLRSDIRRGIYGILLAVSLLLGGMFGILFLLRRRRRKSERLNFTDQVQQLLEEREETGLEDNVNASMADFRDISRRMMEDSGEESLETPYRETQKAHPPADRGGRGMTIGEAEEEPEPMAAASQEGHFLAETGDRQTITEQIKALVMKMHREGRSTEEICRASDLTRTEVELIIAVRAKHVEHIVAEAVDENDDELDTDHLYAAIDELTADGHSPREVARRLGLSTSEINFALAVMKRDANN